MGYGIVEIAFPLVFGEESVGIPFPHNTRIITVEPGQWERTFKLVLAHPDIPNDGPTPVAICPTFRNDAGTTTMVDWGVIEKD